MKFPGRFRFSSQERKLTPEQQQSVAKLKSILGDKDYERFERLVHDEMAIPPKIAVIGKSGVGKSTTINALFGLDESVSHTSTGTKVANENVVILPDGSKLSVIDMPGLGEDLSLDAQYKEVYRRVLPNVDVVLYLVQANMKAMKYDQRILRDIVQDVMGNLRGRIVIGLNQVDKIEPANWNLRFNYPSPQQEDNINRRCQDIQKKLSQELSLGISQIEYYSATKRYRLYNLLAALIKAAGTVGWKFSLNPADPIDLAEEAVQPLLRKETGL